MNKLYTDGISPAVGVILLIGITAAVATLAGIVLLDIGDLQETTTSGIEVQETPDKVSVSWNQEGNAEKVQVEVDGEKVGTLNKVNDRLDLTTKEGSNVSIIGITKSGDKSKISSMETKNYTSETTEVINYTSNPDESVSGTLVINSGIPNATVQSVENGSVIASTTTNGSGNFTIKTYDTSKVVFRVDGFTYTDSGGTDRTVYTSIVRDANLDSSMSVEIPENFQQASIDNSTVDVVYEKEGGVKQIAGVEQLRGIVGDLSADYELQMDVDASSGNGNGFEPIGTDTTPFTGTFDGNNYDVKNLSIDRYSDSYVGLFAKIENSTVQNVGLPNADIRGGYSSGTLVGSAVDSTVLNTYMTGVADLKGNSGGLVGSVDNSTVSSSYAKIDLDLSGSYGGGLVGSAGNSTVKDSYSKGSVYTTSSDTGGLIGEAYTSEVLSSYSEASVTSESYSVGGLVGSGGVLIEDSYATGNVTGNETDVGGLVGYGGQTVRDSYATGDVVNNGSSVTTGGLIGSRGDKILNSYATGDVTGNGTTGGLSSTANTVKNSYYSGTINNTSGENTGGLVGATFDNNGSIENSYVKGTINGNIDVGGLTGELQPSMTISNSYSTANVNGSQYVGGLVGLNKGTINNSYSTGEVPTSGVFKSGGLIGNISSDATAENLYWGTETSGISTAIGNEQTGSTVTNVNGLTTSEMTGTSAETNMSALDFSEIWKTTDLYPEFQE